MDTPDVDYLGRVSVVHARDNNRKSLVNVQFTQNDVEYVQQKLAADYGQVYPTPTDMSTTSPNPFAYISERVRFSPFFLLT